MILLAAGSFLISGLSVCVAMESSPAALEPQPEVVIVAEVLEVGAGGTGTSEGGILVVSIREVSLKPAGLVLAKDDRVSVRVKDKAGIRVGQALVIYSMVWMLGDDVSLDEVKHESLGEKPSPERVQERAKEIKYELALVRERRKAMAWAAADSVIVGRVDRVYPTAVPALNPQKLGFSERSPDWHEAIVHVTSWLSGETRGDEVLVRFPKSLDMAWVSYRELRVGQEGIFVLERDKVSGVSYGILPSRKVVPAYVVRGANSVLATSDAARVQAAIEAAHEQKAREQKAEERAHCANDTTCPGLDDSRQRDLERRLSEVESEVRRAREDLMTQARDQELGNRRIGALETLVDASRIEVSRLRIRGSAGVAGASGPPGPQGPKGERGDPGTPGAGAVPSRALLGTWALAIASLAISVLAVGLRYRHRRTNQPEAGRRS